MGTAAGLRTLFYRPLQPEDFVAVKAAHAALFPIDYDDNFYYKATNGLDRIWSCAAFTVGPFGEEQLAGFITAKIVHLHECDISDRQHMGLLSPLADHDHVMYILTLGVLESYRQQGVASHLIGCVCRHAHETGCRAVFLHVISYNAAAMSLYTRAGFCCVARMAAFYHIATGRQPDPSTQVYDAFLYVLFTGPGGPGQAGSSWDLLTMAWSPLRSALGRIHSCMPQFCWSQPCPGSSSTATCGGTCSATAGAAATHRSSSCNSVNSYNPQAVDLQQPQQQLLPPYSRHRHRHRPQSPTGTDDKQLLQQQQQQQQSLLLPPVVPNHAHLQQYQQQWQQQHQYIQQERRVQHHHRQQQQATDPRRQQQRTSPQRVLHWLFNGSSRAPGAAAATQGYQQPQAQQAQGPQQQKEEP